MQIIQSDIRISLEKMLATHEKSTIVDQNGARQTTRAHDGCVSYRLTFKQLTETLSYK